MAGTSPAFFDLAKLKLDSTWITIGRDMDFQKEFEMANAQSTWNVGAVQKPVSVKRKIVINYVEMVGNVDYDALEAMEDGAAHTYEAYPEGDAAGIQIETGTCYVSTTGKKGTATEAATGTLTLSVITRVKSPNIVLNTQTVGTIAAGGAGSGLTTLVASGGTGSHSLTLVTQLPLGLTMNSSGVFGGTLNAGTVAGTHSFTVRVTDSAQTPVVKDFVVTVITTA